MLSAGSAYVTVKPLFNKANWATAGKIAATGFGVAAVAGIGAIKLASDFEDSMSKIIGLVGISRKQVDAWSKDILDLSKKLPQSPKELADAMFFITSAGLRGKAALDALKVSARASAAGLGDTKTVADAVTSAMNAYGPKVLSAGKATDILTAAVREGKLEAGSLAPVIGKTLPIAKAMGVSFEEVAGSMALMSKSGTDAAQASTQVTAILGSFAKPSAGMISALKTMHLSLDDVRKSLANKGMVPTLAMLRDESKKAGVDLSKVFGNKRALTGVLQLTGNLKETNSVMRGVADSAGATDKAFDEASKTTKFKFNSALSSMQVVGIKLGTQMLPLVNQGLGKFSDGLDHTSAIAKNVSGFLGKIPGPVRSIGVQMIIASFALTKINAGLVTGRARFTAWTATIGASEKGLTRLQRAGVVAQAGMKNLAGAGGMLLLARGAGESNKSVATLEQTLGGAATGFALGGPVGAAVGGLAGLMLGLARHTKKAGDAAADSSALWKHYADTLNDASAATTRQTTAAIQETIRAKHLDTTLGKYGYTNRQIVAAIKNGGPLRSRMLDDLRREQLGIEDTTMAIVKKHGWSSKEYHDYATSHQARSKAIVQTIAELGAVDKAVAAKKDDIAATRTFSKALKALPDKKETYVRAVGLKPGIAGVVELARQIKLTPDEIKILIRENGGKGTDAEVKRVQDRAAALGKMKPVVVVGANTSPAITAINKVLNRNWSTIVDVLPFVHAPAGQASTKPVKKAYGGRVLKDHPYVVGDRGPRSAWELFVPDQNGQIQPHVSFSAYRDPMPGELTRRATAAASVTSSPSLSGARMRLVVGDREFDAYVDERADTRVASAASFDGMAERAFT
jgi:TP901 family phage tail tape measure protein